jgi:hypothetical protein
MEPHEIGYDESSEFHAMGNGVSLIRMKAIEYAFIHIYREPPEDTWVEIKLITSICRILQITYNSHSLILRCLRDVVVARKADREYDVRARGKKRGRKPLIQEMDECAVIVYNAMASGLSMQSSTVMVNEFRRSLLVPLPAISWSAVRRFVSSSKMIQMHRRQTKKSGKDDKDGPWALARMAQCIMMRTQLEIGQHIVTGDLRAAAALIFQHGLRPLVLHAITWSKRVVVRIYPHYYTF